MCMLPWFVDSLVSGHLAYQQNRPLLIFECMAWCKSITHDVGTWPDSDEASVYTCVALRQALEPVLRFDTSLDRVDVSFSTQSLTNLDFAFVPSMRNGILCCRCLHQQQAVQTGIAFLDCDYCDNRC